MLEKNIECLGAVEVQQQRGPGEPQAVAGHARLTGTRTGCQRDDQDRKVST